MKDVRDMNRNKERYYKINNNHIILQISYDHLKEIIETSANKPMQHYHIFEINPPVVDTLIMALIDTVHIHSKVIIHIHPEMKDMKTYLEYKIRNNEETKDKTNWRVIIDDEMVVFNWRLDGYKNKALGFEGNIRHCIVKWSHINDQYTVQIFFDLMAFLFNDSWYLPYCDNNQQKDAYSRIFQSRISCKYPEMFKDELVKRFKKFTPAGILESFKDDDDIFNYLSDHENWE
jgi:hypothetical protein